MRAPQRASALFDQRCNYLQLLAGSVAVALLFVEGLVVPPASRRAQSLASPPEAPEFWPFMFVLLLPFPLLSPEFWPPFVPEVPDVPVSVPLGGRPRFRSEGVDVQALI
jgi:hypothetical protein